jgi:hypothetical protein
MTTFFDTPAVDLPDDCPVYYWDEDPEQLVDYATYDGMSIVTLER